MRNTLAAALLLTVAAAAPVRGAAAADGPEGRPCSYTAVRDEAAEGGRRRVGVVAAGPYSADGTVTCTVQVGAPEHAAKDAASASASGKGTVVLAPTIIGHEDVDGLRTYLCTALDWYEHGTLYWSGGGWTPDPYAPCDVLTTTVPYVSPPPIPLTGWIQIATDVSTAPASSPVTFTTGGYLANPSLWTCDETVSYGPGPGMPYHVTCVAEESIGLVWSCNQLGGFARAFPYGWVRRDLTGVAVDYGEYAAAGLLNAVDTLAGGGWPELEPDLPPPVLDPVVWGEVVATAECSDGVNGWSGVTTGVAKQGQAIQLASAATNVVPVTVVRCWAKDSYGMHADPNYHATCTFG